MTLNIAMIGCGYFGTFHLEAWRRMESVNLVGIAEAGAERRETIQHTYPDCPIAETIDEFLTGETIDIIDVATPPATHFSIISKLAGRVPTIICQKPFCQSITEAEELISIAERENTTLIVHENFRFMPWYRMLKDIIERGLLGRVRQACFRLRPGDGGGEDAYLSRQPYFRDMPRFLIHETGIHWIDTFRFLFGEPSQVYADLWQENPVIRGEDSGFVLYDFNDNVRAIFDANRTLDHSADNHRLTMGEFLVEGTDASIRLDGYGSLFLRRRGEKTETQIDCSFDETKFGGDCIFQFQSHVVSHVLYDTPLETAAETYLKNMKIESGVYESANQKRPVRLN